jgi:hypothetical protein
LLSPQVSSPRISMDSVGGAGALGARGGEDGGQENILVQPPRIFSKVTTRYSPLALRAILCDLPENYMKSLPKFTSEGDLTAT